jgi:hypothetical protein
VHARNRGLPSLPSGAPKTSKSLVRCSQCQRQEKSWNGNPPQEENQNVKKSGQDGKRHVLPNGTGQHRPNISWKGFVASSQPTCESPSQVKNNRASRNGGKVPQRPAESSLNRRGPPPELIAKIVQSTRVEQQCRGRDNDGQENVKGKLPELGFRDEQPRRKQPRQDGVHEKLQQPQPAASQTAGKNKTWSLKVRHYFTSIVAGSLVASSDG